MFKILLISEGLNCLLVVGRNQKKKLHGALMCMNSPSRSVRDFFRVKAKSGVLPETIK